MAEEEAAHHLLNVLEERELHVDLDRVLAVFEDASTKKDAAEWVNEYLNTETLLTKEELELYQTLRKKGVLHQYENDEPVRPILDHELSTAIDSLKSSTAAIEKQCKVLEAQYHALMELKALDRPNLSVEHMRNDRRRKDNQEKGRLDTAVDDISVSITEQLTDTQRDIEAEKSTLKSYLAERLASDDQILSKVPGIVSQILSSPEVNEDENSIDQWCQAIISFRTAEVKAKVDCAYLNSLANSSSDDLPRGSEEDLGERKAALQAELETLHSEIASVAEMVVEHELRKPMTDIKKRKDGERTQARSAWLNYVLSTLEYMGKRLDTVTTHMENVDDFQQALAHVKAAASQRMPAADTEALTMPRRRTTSGPKSNLFTAIKLKPTKSLDLPPVLQDALRQAGISFNQDSVEALQDSLVRTQLEREKKLENHYVSASSSTHERLAERLDKADVDSRTILDALYSHTPFSQVHLTNPELEKQLKELEKEMEESDHKLLSAESNQLSLSDPKVRAFIGKYGK
ncbi:hypothetical protein K504DRAFT_368685 [Pleomassaria siparia CBS 279.74]|uniref:HAUS augmin-like complex subunit 3 N-terminal domain-containing protein n=1 Tax=Pleomassaria siparia CBS 279.74 TaxID=1314801 RepID=A0A6G1KP39_9PLEO|nr:hypothetical protein K504DRAFT_368685 [Pleomassaria siparia CBS 279.74]